MRKHSFLAIGTNWELLVFDELADGTWNAVLTSIQASAADFEQRYSRFIADSFVMNLKKGRQYTLENRDLPLFTLYEQLNQLSDGLFTPLVGQLLSQAGYDSEYSLQVKRISAVPAYTKIVQRQGSTLHLFEDAQLDFGAAGKGYLVDLLAELCEEFGLSNYLLDGSGDMRHRWQNSKQSGSSSIRVGLEHPLDQQQAIGIVELTNQSIAGSASNRRRWGQWHHIVDPHRRAPVNEVLATWVVVDRDQQHPTMVADALATALFLIEPEKLTPHFPFSYVIYYQNGTVQKAANFRGELFT